MEGITPLNRLVAGIAIILLGLLAYLPALNNPFIADDYAFLHYVQPLENGWSHLADIPLGLRRLTSSLFFIFVSRFSVFKRLLTTAPICCSISLILRWSGCWCGNLLGTAVSLS